MISPEDDLASALKLLTEQNINQLPVIEDGKLKGIIARDNLLSFISVRSELRVR